MGGQIIFFHSHWEEVKYYVFEVVKECYKCPSRLEDINQTLLVMIPKVDVPENFKQLQPIGLCNVIYKIVSKIYVIDLKVVMPRLVAPNQCSFV